MKELGNPIVAITISKPGTVNAVGRTRNANSRPVFCITTLTPYTSGLDAAIASESDPSCISSACRGKVKTCAGKRWCFVDEIMLHFDEIVEVAGHLNDDAAAYRAIVAEREAKIKAQNERDKHRAKCAKLREELEKELRLLEEAEKAISEEEKC